MTMLAPFADNQPNEGATGHNTIHTLNIFIPTWQRAVDIISGEPEVWKTIHFGYPRFVLNTRVLQLGRECLKQLKLDASTYGCLPMLTSTATKLCCNIVHKLKGINRGVKTGRLFTETCMLGRHTLHVVVYPREDHERVRFFWLLAGDGVCSRFADTCLKSVGIPDAAIPLKAAVDPMTTASQQSIDDCLPEKQADRAKQLIRQRVAAVIHATYSSDADDAGARFTRQHPSALALTENSVYLYPSGMSAIFHMHRMLGFMESERKIVCFGLPYLSTYKLLSKFGTGSILFGNGTEEEIDMLEQKLADPTQEPILSIFCEFPSNPLLRATDIRRLRALADKHDVPLLIDVTVGGFSNSQLLPLADAVVLSLGKSFNGECNVMSGCIVVNASRPHGARLQHALNVDAGDGRPGYEDTVWWEDALVLERNCRTFMERDARVNRTTEIICDYLRAHPKVANVYYPKYVTRDIYDSYKRPGGGYGCLLSLLLHTPEEALRFYDALPCVKSVSFGTNRTIACPYTAVIHNGEEEWAAQHGIAKHLIRFSIGLEEPAQIRSWLDTAFAAI